MVQMWHNLSGGVTAPADQMISPKNTPFIQSLRKHFSSLLALPISPPIVVETQKG